MEGLDDIIFSEGENTPPNWNSRVDGVKSNRYSALKDRQCAWDNGVVINDEMPENTTRFETDFLSENLSRSQAEWLKSEMKDARELPEVNLPECTLFKMHDHSDEGDEFKMHDDHSVEELPTACNEFTEQKLPTACDEFRHYPDEPLEFSGSEAGDVCTYDFEQDEWDAAQNCASPARKCTSPSFMVTKPCSPKRPRVAQQTVGTEGMRYDELPIRSAGAYNFDDILNSSDPMVAEYPPSVDLVEEAEGDHFEDTRAHFEDDPIDGNPIQGRREVNFDVHFDDSVDTSAENSPKPDEVCSGDAQIESPPDVKKKNDTPTASTRSGSFVSQLKFDTDTMTTMSPEKAGEMVSESKEEVSDVLPVTKKPFLRKGTRQVSSLRPKGGPLVSFACSRSKQTKEVENMTDATPSASSTQKLGYSTQGTEKTIPEPQRNPYKEAYNARFSSPVKTPTFGPPSATRPKIEPRNLMWDDDSDEIAEDKTSFMDFMRSKGLSDAELKRMAARTNKDFKEDTRSDQDCDSQRTPAAKKGFREYYRDKFGSPGYSNLSTTIGNEEKEKRAFRSLYHETGPKPVANTNSYTIDEKEKGAPSYASLWKEEVSRKEKFPFDEQVKEEYDAETAPVSNLVRKHFYKPEPKKTTKPVKEKDDEQDEELRLALQQKLTQMDAQIARFKKENEQCKKLRLEREQALRDAEKDREKMQAEMDKERERMRAELEEEAEKVRRERKRVEQERDRHRQQLTQSRSDQDEVLRLRQEFVNVKEEFAQKEARLRRTVERLTKQNDDLKKKLAEVNDEIAWAQKATGRRQEDAVVPKRASTPISAPKEVVKEIPETIQAPRIERDKRKPSDGRVERVHPDGSREIEFPNGLKKILHSDGSCLVQFANGDTKECKKDGSVVYRYAGTKATQTTLPSGVELFDFASGQSETHYPDGSKEIRFPNGTTKRIAADGTENVSFKGS